MTRLVCIGDSITAGQFLEPAEAWPALLNTSHEVFSRAVPGDTTRMGLERFPRDVQRMEPGIVVIQFGHNDANRWDTDRGLPRVSELAFMANLIEMADRVRTFGAEPYVCSLTPSRRCVQHADDVDRYDQLVRKVSHEVGVRLIDVRAAFEEGWLMDDGLHLTAAGQRGYAATVERALR